MEVDRQNLAGSVSKILALQCSRKFTARKNCPIHDSHVNNGSVADLAQNAGTPIRSVQSLPTETAGCAMWNVNRQKLSYKNNCNKNELLE